MKMTADDLLGFGIIDKIIPEHPEGAHIEPEVTFEALKKELLSDLRELMKLSGDEVYNQKFNKFRSFGVFE